MRDFYEEANLDAALITAGVVALIGNAFQGMPK